MSAERAIVALDRAAAIERVDAAQRRWPLFDKATLRRIEVEAMRGLPPYTLMARAGEAAARLAIAVAPHASRVLVFVGPGNNGGDGLAAAACLRAWGRPVQATVIGAPSVWPTDAAMALDNARQAGVEIASFAAASTRLDGGALIVDALLGLGTSRAPEGELAAAIAGIAGAKQRGATVLAVDTPSGFDADRGRPFGDHCITADHTLALIAPRPGLFTADGRDRAGQVWLASLGTETSEPCSAWLVGAHEQHAALEPRRHAQHKGSFGDVAVVGGANGMTGAALLAARAAHAAGAGRVFLDLLDDSGHALGVDLARPELMLQPGWWRREGHGLERSTVVCGCGGGDAVRAALPRLLSRAARLVLDADALNAIAADAGLLAQLAARRARQLATILTPHPLEAARLLGSSTDSVQTDRLAAARELADRCQSVVVLKGSGSVIAEPGQPPRINATGNASLASGGTGDVLAGWIGGRWRADVAAIEAATLGVVEHGLAAEPEHPGAWRAADLIDRLHALSRGA